MGGGVGMEDAMEREQGAASAEAGAASAEAGATVRKRGPAPRGNCADCGRAVSKGSLRCVDCAKAERLARETANSPAPVVWPGLRGEGGEWEHGPARGYYRPLSLRHRGSRG